MAVIDQQLEKALASAKKGEPKKALAALLAAWESTRAPELSEAIAAADAALALKPFDGDTDAWVKQAKLAGVEDRGPLLAALKGPKVADTQRRLEAAAKWSRDARTSRALEALIREVPYSSDSSKPAWRAAFELVRSLDDPRWLALQQELPAQWNVRSLMRTWLVGQFEDAVEDLKPGEPLSGTQSKTCAEIATALAAKAPKPKAGPKDPAALLAEIYAHPGDDAPRLVYADWLQEQGDPRGEFIALQFKREKTSADLKREKALLKEHGRKWLGPLDPVMLKEPLEYRRGFPAVGAVKFRHQADAKKFGALPEWGTLVELTWSHPNPVPVGQETGCRFIGPAFHGLKVAIGPWHRLLLESKTPWALEEIGGEFDDVEVFLAILSSPLFPKLTRIGLSGFLAHNLVSAVKNWGQVTHLTTDLGQLSYAQWLGVVEKTPLKSLTLNGYLQGVARFERDAAGDFSKVSLDVRAPAKKPQIVATLGGLPEGYLVDVSVTGNALTEDEARTAARARSASQPRVALGASSALTGQSEAPRAMAMDETGALVSLEVNRLRRVEAKTGATLASMAINHTAIFALDPAGTRAATAQWRRLELFDVRTLRRAQQLPRDGTQPHHLFVSTAGRVLLSAQGGVTIYDFDSAKVLFEVSRPASVAALWPDGSFALGADSGVTLYDAAARELRSVDVAAGQLRSLAPLDQGFAVSTAGELRSYGLDGALRAKVELEWPFLTASPDGRALVALSHGRMLALDPVTLAQRWQKDLRPLAVAFSADSKSLLFYEHGYKRVAAATGETLE